MIRCSIPVAMAGLLLSGCTTRSEHLYLFPNGIPFDDGPVLVERHHRLARSLVDPQHHLI